MPTPRIRESIASPKYTLLVRVMRFYSNSCQRLARARGIGKLTLLVFGTIIGVAVYCGFQIIPFYYYYFELLNQMESAIRVASTNSDEEIRQKLMYHIKKMQMPIEPEDLKIYRYDGKMKISMQYDEVFFITWEDKDYDLHTFHFDATVERTY